MNPPLTPEAAPAVCELAGHGYDDQGDGTERCAYCEDVRPIRRDVDERLDSSTLHLLDHITGGDFRVDALLRQGTGTNPTEKVRPTDG